MNNPQLFGTEHIAYLIITTAVLIVALIFLKRGERTEQETTRMFRIIGLIGLVSIAVSRLSVALILPDRGLIYLIPDSICGTSSLFMAIALLFFKRDGKLLHIVTVLAIIGDVVSLAYPDFIGQAPSIFYLPTITGLWHHSWTLFSAVCVFMFRYMVIDIRKAYLQLFGVLYFLIVGVILIFAGGLPDAFYLIEPAVPGTHLYFGVLLVIYLAVYAVIVALVYLRRKRRARYEPRG